MSKRERLKTIFLYIVFFCYVATLIKVLFLSRVSLSELFHGQREVTRAINLIPFHSIGQFILGTGTVKSFAFGNVIGNIILFVPLGLYLPLLKNNKKVLANLLIVFIASLLTEIIQGVLGIGTSDIDDIILNCLGGWIGILVYKLFVLVFRDENKVRTAVIIPSALIGLPVIYYFMFLLKMRF